MERAYRGGMELKGYRGKVAFDGHNVFISKPMRGQVVMPLHSIATAMIIPAGIDEGVEVHGVGDTGCAARSAHGEAQDSRRGPVRSDVPLGPSGRVSAVHAVRACCAGSTSLRRTWLGSLKMSGSV